MSRFGFYTLILIINIYLVKLNILTRPSSKFFVDKKTNRYEKHLYDINRRIKLNEGNLRNLGSKNKEAKRVETKKVETKKEELKKVETKKEEPKKLEIRKEELKKVKVKKEEPKRVEVKKEEPQRVETKNEEPQKIRVETKQEPKRVETRNEINNYNKESSSVSEFKLVIFIVLLIFILIIVVILLVIIIVLIFRKKESQQYIDINKSDENKKLEITPNNVMEEMYEPEPEHESKEMNEVKIVDDTKVTSEEVQFLKKIMKKKHK